MIAEAAARQDARTRRLVLRRGLRGALGVKLSQELLLLADEVIK